LILQAKVQAYLPYPECLDDPEGCEPPSYIENALNAGFGYTEISSIVECNNPDSNIFLIQIIELPITTTDFTGFVFKISGFYGHAILFFTFCVCYLYKCFPRVIRRSIFMLVSFLISFIIILQILQFESCRNSLILFYFAEYTIISLIFAASSRTWNYLKNIRVIGDGENFSIWKELKIDGAPEVRVHIECYHMEMPPEAALMPKNSIEYAAIEAFHQEKVVTYSATKLVPYTTWWICDGVGNQHELENASKTNFGICQGTITFASFEYSVQLADDGFTKNQLEEIRSSHYEDNKHRDKRCKATIELHADHGPEKITWKSESMKLPICCQPLYFWIFTLLPLPFFNGALIRLIVNSKYVESRKNICRYIEIRQNGDLHRVNSHFSTVLNSIQPAMDQSRAHSYVPIDASGMSSSRESSELRESEDSVY